MKVEREEKLQRLKAALRACLSAYREAWEALESEHGPYWSAELGRDKTVEDDPVVQQATAALRECD